MNTKDKAVALARAHIHLIETHPEWSHDQVSRWAKEHWMEFLTADENDEQGKLARLIADTCRKKQLHG